MNPGGLAQFLKQFSSGLGIHFALEGLRTLNFSVQAL